ncbi:MAG: ATP-binding protein [Firmicutes bacterium]|nr:ATP-binding protein [Bacillota bacterium]
MIDKRLKLLLPSKPESLNAIRDEVRSFISGTAYEDKTSDILLVISEACTNVVRHAYPKGRRKAVIVVECDLKDDYLTIMVCDNGKGLTPACDAPLFTEDGGFGLFLMQKLSDKFKCHSSPGSGTVVQVAFKNPAHHALKFNRRVAHAVVEPASVLLHSFIDTFSHPKRNFLAYRACFEDGLSSAVYNLKSYWKAVAILHFIRSRLGDLEKSLKNESYSLARIEIEDMVEQVKVLKQEFCHVPPEGRILLKRYLEHSIDKLSRLEQAVKAGEPKKKTRFSAMCALNEKNEIAYLISQLLTDLGKVADDKIGCWVSLDKEPLKLI